MTLNLTDEKLQQQKLKTLFEWKRLYIEALIAALNPKGETLEIGFDLGFGAESIQKRHPKKHTIIESDPEIFDHAKQWANGRPNVAVLKGRWQDLLPNLGKFEAIFFNDYSHREQDLSLLNFLFPEDYRKKLAEAKKFISSFDDQIAELHLKFSNKDIEAFYQKMGKSNLKELPLFFKKLKENGNISNEQYETYMKKYKLQSGAGAAKSPEGQVQKQSANKPPAKSDMLICLEECLKNHMAVGSRFSCFLNTPSSLYEDAQFFDAIITDPNIDYKEDTVTLKMSDKPRDALIVRVEKTG